LLVPHNYENVGGFYLPLRNYKRELELLGHNIFIFRLPYHLKSREKRNYSASLNSSILLNKIDCLVSFSLNQSYMLSKQLKLNGFKGRQIGFLVDSMRLHAKSILKMRGSLTLKIKNRLRSILYTYKERACLNYFSDVIYVSSVDANYVKYYYKPKNRIHCIPNGVVIEDVEDFSKKLKNCRIGMLTGFSNDTIQNNLIPFLNGAFPRLRSSISNIEFVIAGKGATEKTSSMLRRTDGVIFLGYVDKLEDFYNEVDVVITTVKKECGILNRVLEAWSFGKVVVGYRRNFAAFEKAKEGTHFLSADSAEEFVDRLSNIQNGGIDLAKIGFEAHNLVKNDYTWVKAAQSLADVIITNEESSK